MKSSKVNPFGSRKPAMKIRSRCCGTQVRASSTFQWTWYPSSSVSVRWMTRNVLPRSWLTRFLTFSSRKACGRRASRIRATSKNSVPCASHRKPCGCWSAFFLETPAIENGWHGNSARSRSCSGTSVSLTPVMSPAMPSVIGAVVGLVRELGIAVPLARVARILHQWGCTWGDKRGTGKRVKQLPNHVGSPHATRVYPDAA